MTDFTPLHDRVLVRRHDSETTSPGGILIPDNAREPTYLGTVIAAGPGTFDGGPTTVRTGQTVAFGKWSGAEIKVGGETLLVMKEGDIFGVFDEWANVHLPRDDYGVEQARPI